MEVQICLQEELIREAAELPDAERLVVESGISFHQAQAELAQRAGFGAQVKIHRRKEKEFERKLLPLPPFPVVSEAEYEVWRLFLPTSYPRREWAGYQFDLIPPDVLEVVRVHGYLFDEMEIRTPEVRKSDPVIFGKRGDARYIIARWAESRLIPFEEVKATVLNGLSSSSTISGSVWSVVTIGLGALTIWGSSVFLIACVPLLIFTTWFWCDTFSSRRKCRQLTRMLAASSAQPVRV